MSVTVQDVILRILYFKGITQFTPQPAGSELEDCNNSDLDDALFALNGAMQEIHAAQPLVNMEESTGGYLHGPTAVTLTATAGSQVISALTTYAAWMLGCTIRVQGDDQDNEIVSATRLARPFVGNSGAGLSAVVYGDCLTLPSNYSRAIAPVCLPNQLPLPICDSMDEFLRLAGWPAVVGLDGRATSTPFFYFIRKSIARPLVVLAQGAYDATLSSIPRRLRFAPMPDQAYPVGFRAALTAPRYTRADVVSPLVTLTASGAGDASANQSYTYLMDVNGYRMFKGVSSAAYAIFFHPGLGEYILCATLTAASTPAAYWSSDLVTSPLGTFTPNGTAVNTVTVTTSDTGGGEADPGTLLPIVDEAVESVLLPIALQRFTGTAGFKNEAAKPEIARQYKTAKDKLSNSRAIGASQPARYV